MASTDKKKAEFYRWAKIGGLISFIPVALAAGPLAGYFLGEYLDKKFGFAPYLTLLCLTLGFVTSVMEIIKILRLIYNTDKKSDRIGRSHDASTRHRT